MQLYSRGRKRHSSRGNFPLSRTLLLLFVSLVLASWATEVFGGNRRGSSEEEAVQATREFLEEFRDEFDYLDSIWPGGKKWDYCSGFAHISCDENDMISLDLAGLGLDGDFPELPHDDEGHLVKVKSINMANNPRLSSDLEEWGYITQLKEINLAGTSAKGKLPRAWKGLVNLRVILLTNTRVKGSLPKEWQTMTSLVTLNLGGSQVEGGLPEEWQAMSQLSTLTLSSTRLYGALPMSWTMKMVNLQQLDLSGTGVTSVLSSLTSPQQFPALRALDLSHPTVASCGTLPSGVRQWAGSHLETLNMVGHRNCGCLPPSWRDSEVLVSAARRANVRLLSPTCAIEEEQRCVAERNMCVSLTFSTTATTTFLQELRRAFPDQLTHRWTTSSYCDWPGISCSSDSNYPCISVDLSGFGLTGSLPADIGSRVIGFSVYVDDLILRDNEDLLGEFPVTLDAALPFLRRLDLSHTGMFGPIPAWTGFQYLQQVSIAGTNACMNLPAWRRDNFPWLAAVDLSDNNLRGSLADSWSSFLATDSHLVALSLRGNMFCRCLPSAAWASPHSIAAGAFDASTAAALSASSCAATNACGNSNQQCLRGAASPSSGEATLRFLQALRDAFPNQLASSWAGANYCSGHWLGVTCTSHAATGAQEVVVNLARSSLTGTLPQVPLDIIGSRVLITSMDFSNNEDIKGTLPVLWGTLGYLRALNLGSTHASGHIPDAWRGLASLESITISKSMVCRGLPDWDAASMPNLRYVDFSSNFLIGGLSAEFGSLGPQLIKFDVSSNVFCSCVPSTWTADILLAEIRGTNERMLDEARCANENGCRASSLRCYEADGEQELFSDPSTAFLTRLRDAFLASTPTTSGSAAIKMLKTWTSNSASSLDDYCHGWEGIRCDDLDGFSIDLSNTGLAGTLPPVSDIQFPSTIAVISINLADNPGLEGTLPVSWGLMENLRSLNFSHTGLSSSIPVPWQRLSSLRSLSLAHTNVCGALPAWDVGQLASIESLDLSNNKLSGTLVRSWSDFGLTRLASLDLAGNPDLCECVPHEWLTGYSLVSAVMRAFGAAGGEAQCGNCPTPAGPCATPGSGEDPHPTDPSSSSSGDKAFVAGAPLSLATVLCVATTLGLLLA